MLITGSYCCPWLDAIFNIWAVLHIYHLKNYESWSTFAHRISGRGLRAWNVNDSCNIISLAGATGKLSFRHLLHPCPNFSPRSVRTGKKGHHMHALFNRNEGVFSCNKGKCIPFPGVLVGINKKYWQSDPKHQRRPPFSRYGVYACTRAWVTKRRVSVGEARADVPALRLPGLHAVGASIRASPEHWQGGGGGPDLRQGLAHSKGPMKVRPRLSLPQNLVISGGAVPGIISQEVSPLDGVRLLLGELQGRSGNRPLCTVSLCQTLWWAWETRCVLLTRLSSSFTAAKLIMTWFPSLSDTEGTLRKLGNCSLSAFQSLPPNLEMKENKGPAATRRDFASLFFQWHSFVLAEVTLDRAVRRGRGRCRARPQSEAQNACSRGVKGTDTSSFSPQGPQQLIVLTEEVQKFLGGD